MKRSIFFIVLISLIIVACNTLSLEGFVSPSATAIPATPEHPSPGSAGLNDAYFPELGNGGYDVLHYAIELDVDMDSNEIDGSANLEIVASQDLSSINLDFVGLEIDEILVNEETASYEREGRELVLFLPTPLNEGQSFTVSVFYRGTPGEGLDTSELEDYEVGWGFYGDGVYVAGEPTGSSSWYPVNEHPLDKATYSFRITVENPYVVAANGLLQDTIEQDGQTIYVWESADPIASYLVTLGIAEFDIETEEGPNGLPIRNYFGVGVSRSVRQDFSRTAEMIEVFSQLFGPYPLEAYGVIVHDLDLGFALETQTLSVFGRSFTVEYVVSHELAHQWYGDSVSLASWQDIWLNEGFATYASILWAEHAYGLAEAENALREMYSDMAIGEPTIYPPPGDPNAENLFARSVYQRGALTLHALRLEVGDAAFFDILPTYAERFENSNASIADFISLAEEISGQDLGDLFDGWLYESKMPDMPELDLFLSDFLD